MTDSLRKNSKPFRLLLIGGGPVVRSLHLPAMRALGWVAGSMAVDLSTTSLQDLVAIEPELQTKQGDYRSILADNTFCETFDAALVSLPNSLHATAVEFALNSGLAVLCEKPLAMSGDDCVRIQAAELKTGRPLKVAMVMRHVPGLQAMRNAIVSGLIGDTCSVDVEDGNPFAWDSDSGGYFNSVNGGVLLNMGVHFLDLLSCLFGPLVPNAYADDFAGGVEANFEFRLRAGSIPVRLEVSYTRTLRNTIVVSGTEGTLIFDKSSPAECQWKKGPLSGTLVLEKPYIHGQWIPSMLASFAEQLAAFGDFVRDGGTGKNLASVEDALATSRLMDWAVTHRTSLNERVNRVSVSTEMVTSITGRVAVTGGTGFVGTRLLGALTQCNNTEVVTVVRAFKNGAMAGRLPVRVIRADLLDFDALSLAFRGSRHVFHLAYGSDGADARRTTIEGTLNACKAAVKEGVESIVVVGTTAVYGPQAAGVIVDETYPLRRKGTEYELAKAEMVRQVLAFAASANSGKTRITVLEPACIYGPGGKPFTELPINLAKTGQFVWIENGSGVANLVFVDSFVDALLRASVAEGVHGQRFIIQDCAVTWREFLEPLLGEYASGLSSICPKELNRQQTVGMIDVFKAALRSPEVTKTLAAWPFATWGRQVLGKRAPGLIKKLRNAKKGAYLSSGIAVAGETRERSAPPQWIVNAYGTGSPKLSNEKACRVLGWKPHVLKVGQDLTIAWLRYARLREQTEKS